MHRSMLGLPPHVGFRIISDGPINLEPLKQWKCDTCGETITTPDDGYVEWKKDEKGRSIEFRLIHQSRKDGIDPHRCSYPLEYPSSFSVPKLMGPDGLAYLLQFIEQESDRGSKVGVRELTELTRRLHIPEYEEARQYFDQAEESGSNPELLTLSQDYLKDVIEEYSEPTY